MGQEVTTMGARHMTDPEAYGWPPDWATDLLAACEGIMPLLDCEVLATEPWEREIDLLRTAIDQAREAGKEP
jgi:hypothetical protein